MGDGVKVKGQWNNTRFTIRYEVEKVFMRFWLYEIHHFELVDGKHIPCVERKECVTQYTSVLCMGSHLISGSIKWDGCSDIRFDQDQIYHGCRRQDMEGLGFALSKAWDIASQNIEGFDGT